MEETGLHKDSMCADIEHCKSTEIDFLGGTVVAYAREAGLSVPFRVRHYRKCHLFFLRIIYGNINFSYIRPIYHHSSLKGGTLNSVHNGCNQCIRGFG
ncbi:MAG: ketopantoate reductase C-terminal domain-containing protein, partial [Desulfobacteraceae bacterium]|nr:ketopantoate reductase C-terminal domain-containing protein [Desulfobacteraceae bacterium]